MSQIIQPRIKQIRQKDNNNNYSTPIPLGADGFLVDMFSGLDLEEELKLGSNHYVEIEERENVTIIKEWYLTESKEEETSISDIPEEKISYSIEIRITSNVFNLALYKGNFPGEEDEKKPLHSKIIKIKENGIKTNINQQLTTSEIEENSTADSAIADIDRIIDQGGE